MIIRNKNIYGHFLFFSGPNRNRACSNQFSGDLEINGAGAICCQDEESCQNTDFRLGSGDELQTSVCCSGENICQYAEFTGSPLSVLSCEGNNACFLASALLAGDLSCNGQFACQDSNVDFQGSNEYLGFAVLVIFPFLALYVRLF